MSRLPILLISVLILVACRSNNTIEPQPVVPDTIHAIPSEAGVNHHPDQSNGFFLDLYRALGTRFDNPVFTRKPYRCRDL
jgi:hypothetical protein